MANVKELAEYHSTLSEHEQRKQAWNEHRRTAPVTDRDTLGMDPETFDRRNRVYRRDHPDNSLSAYIERTEEWWKHTQEN